MHPYDETNFPPWCLVQVDEIRMLIDEPGKVAVSVDIASVRQPPDDITLYFYSKTSGLIRLCFRSQVLRCESWAMRFRRR